MTQRGIEPWFLRRLANTLPTRPMSHHVNVPCIGMMVRVFAFGLGDLVSHQSQVIPKTQKMVLDASLLNTQHYKVWIKGEMEQSSERSSAFPYTLVL